ncbi:hypothetical protein TNCV_3858301 [Trichonephila clavipes]|nr:hypothetical protein TNCV_3858301 [Trichonephila clavipes]
MSIPNHPGIKETVDEIATQILSREGQSQTNAVKAQDMAIVFYIASSHTSLTTRGVGLEERQIFSSTALVVLAATAHKTFGPSDLTSAYSEGIWWHRTQAFQSGVRCFNH